MADTQPSPSGLGFFVAIVDRLVKTYQNMQRNSDPSLIGLDMSAHNVLENQLVADHTLVPPASAGKTVAVDRSPAFLQADTNCVISEPQAAGLRLTVMTVGGVTLTAANSRKFYTSNTNNTEATTITLNSHDIIDLVSVEKVDGNNTYYQYKAL